jgi:hypothetical protein
MIEVECHYTDPPHVHEYPDDWKFGGANGLHPGADPRWKPTTYEYFDDKIQRIHVTQTPLCDDQALDEFTKIARMGPTFNPKWLRVRRPDGTTEMLPWEYNKEQDTFYPTGGN